MSQIAQIRGKPFGGRADGALESRIFRAMIASLALAVIGSTMLLRWRVTAGLMLGGALSLLNYHWLRTSVVAFFDVGPTGRPRVRMSRYVIRYFVVTAAAFAAYELRLVSLAAMF